MSTQPISAKCECKNKILNVKKHISTQCECLNSILNVKNSIFRLSATVKIGFRMSK